MWCFYNWFSPLWSWGKMYCGVQRLGKSFLCFSFTYLYLKVLTIKTNGWVKIRYGHENTFPLFYETLVLYQTSGRRCELDYPTLPHNILFLHSLSLPHSLDHRRKKSLSFTLFINTPSPSSSLQIGAQTFRLANFVGRSEKKFKAGWLCAPLLCLWMAKHRMELWTFDQTHGSNLWHGRRFWWVLSAFGFVNVILFMFLPWKNKTYVLINMAEIVYAKNSLS